MTDNYNNIIIAIYLKDMVILIQPWQLTMQVWEMLIGGFWTANIQMTVRKSIQLHIKKQTDT